MSGNNPYAANSGGGAGQNYNNPYAGRNPYANNPYAGQGTGANAGSGAGANPYGSDPYLQQPNNTNASSTSVNSYGSREARRRDDQQRDPSNPYARQPPRRRSPAPPIPDADSSYDQERRPRAPSGEPGRPGLPAGPASRGYGGLPSVNDQPPPGRPATAGRDGPASRENGRDRSRDRDRAYSDSRSRERRPPQPDPSTMPQRPPQPPQQFPQQKSMQNGSSNLQPPSNGAFDSSINRQYSPRRPTKAMEEIVSHIQTKWNFMEGDECVPVKVALQLADPSSLGLGDREADFSDTHTDLQKSLKSVVNEHYADFNSAVGTYHKIQASIRESQSRVRYLKNGLIEVKGGMLTTRPELRNLAEQSGQLDDLLNTLGQIEQLREMPAKLEEKINEKRWIGAVEVLGAALAGCRKTGIEEIAALSELRQYFVSQENSLVDMLIEELHDHLYLKSPYCMDRWKGRKAGEKAGQGDGGMAWNRPVYHFLSSLDTRKPMTDEGLKNPENDTFQYIQMIVEALNKRGYLDETITRIEQRLPVELYKVVERTNNEIDARYPSHLRNQADIYKRDGLALHANDPRSQVLSDFLSTLYAKFEAIAEGHRVLHEVVLGVAAREKLPKPEQYGASFKELWKLYQMEIRSLLHDYLDTDSDMVSASKKNMANVGDVFSKPPRDKNKRMFKLNEMDQKSADIKAEEAELEEILKTSVPGLVTKSKSTNGINAISDRRDQDGIAAGHKLLIEPSVFNITLLLAPSLAFLQHLRDIVPQTSNIPLSTLTSFLDDFLINVFHPQLEEAVTELCTSSMLDFEAFMEDPHWSRHSPHPIFKGTIGFMTLIRAFSAMLSAIPQDQMFTQLIIGQLFKYYDKCYRFYKGIVSRSANSNSGSSAQIMKVAAALADGGEVHDIVQELWSSTTDSRARSGLNDKEIQLLLTTTKANPLTPFDIISEPKSIHQLSLIYNSMQWLSSSLAHLRNVETSTSTKSHSRNTSLTSGQNPRRWTLISAIKTGQSPNTLTSHYSEAPIFIPLNNETVVPFDETLTSFRTLAQKALTTLHIDIRCGIIHQLGRTLRPPQDPTSPTTDPSTLSPNPISPTKPQPSPRDPIRDSSLPPITSGGQDYPYLLPTPPTSASPLVLKLNEDLISFDTNISAYLGPRERLFILSGLPTLVDRYFIFGADFVGVMNANGAERMRVDATVLLQVLRGLSSAAATTIPNQPPQTDHARTQSTGLGITSPTTPTPPASSTEPDDPLPTLTQSFYTLYLRGPAAILAFVKDRKKSVGATKEKDAISAAVGYTYDELRTLLELCLSSKVRSEDREEGLRAKKELGGWLLELGEVMWDS